MKTLGEVLRLSEAFLTKKGVDRPRRIASELLASLFQMKRMDLYLQFDRPVFEEELVFLRTSLQRSARGEPLEYIIGEIAFYGCRIRVDSRALIPRPETELLADLILKRVTGGVLFDVCTGTGCIGIALKKAIPALDVTLSDISEEALLLARENASLNNVSVSVLKGDLLEPFKGKKADWIVCNPPYISEKEFEALDFSVRGFEPKQALIGGAKGWEFYERCAQEISEYLHPEGVVFFEIGFSQGNILKKLFPKGELVQDWAGHPRFFITPAPFMNANGCIRPIFAAQRA